jgi:hypothetical protein
MAIIFSQIFCDADILRKQAEREMDVMKRKPIP